MQVERCDGRLLHPSQSDVVAHHLQRAAHARRSLVGTGRARDGATGRVSGEVCVFARVFVVDGQEPVVVRLGQVDVGVSHHLERGVGARRRQTVDEVGQAEDGGEERLVGGQLGRLGLALGGAHGVSALHEERGGERLHKHTWSARASRRTQERSSENARARERTGSTAPQSSARNVAKLSTRPPP